MITFSIFCAPFALSVISILSEPTQHPGWEALTSLFIVPGRSGLLRAGRRRLGFAHADALGVLTALPLPAIDRVPELEEGDDPGRDRQPEGDHAVGQNGREDLGAGQAEEDEGADHPG